LRFWSPIRISFSARLSKKEKRWSWQDRRNLWKNYC